ncbi:MAG: T9SS type A sorting domain-containing protein, partial [Bacteroidales bacterium]|nr:T9SS type A sorting domain-containing protein [Bacteroidales bacterium]
NDIDYTTEIYKFFTGQENVPTSIESNVAENFSIYPNPAANIVNVITDRNAELSIFNVTGKEVKHISANENTTSIDISELPNGLYFIVANGIAQKLTIER